MPTTLITPSPGSVLEQLNPVALADTLWRRRSLILQLTRREIEGRYRGSLLGLFWAFFNPLVLLAVYAFVFGVVFQARWPQANTGTVTDYAMTLFCGLIAFNILAECLSRAPGLVIAVPNYVTKVVFPLEILPVALLGSALFHGLVSLGVVVLACLVAGQSLKPTILLLPVVALPLVFVSLGLAWFLASLGVFVRDIGQLIGLTVQVLLFGTPIFYSLESVPAWLRPIMRANPLTSVVENFRRVILWGTLPGWRELAGWVFVSSVIMCLGYAWFAKTKKAFADVI
jgi:lipopolysaccharide transport system permease protein